MWSYEPQPPARRVYERGRTSRSRRRGESMNTVAVLGPGRIGRQIALAFALGERRVLLVDVKARTPEERRAVFADARREITRDLRLMTEEGVIAGGDVASAPDRIEDRTGLDGLDACAFVDRKSTRLNSSHITISYAVFCLKKKKTK